MKKLLVDFFLAFTIFMPCYQSLCLAETSINKEAFIDVVPGKSLGQFKINDTLEEIKKKLGDSIEKVTIENDDDVQQIDIHLKDTTTLSIDIKNNKVQSILWFPIGGDYKYKDTILIPYKTDLTIIKKLFPGGKIVDITGNDGCKLIQLSYQLDKLGIKFIVQPLVEAILDLDKISNKYKICTVEPYQYKLYKCYILNAVYIFKPE